MKKPIAPLATTALIGLFAVGVATPASAATDVSLATYFTTDDFGHEDDAGYPDDAEWFFGQLGSGWTPATVSSSQTGLDISALGTTTAVQILNTDVQMPPEAANLITVIGLAQVHASGSGWSFQLPFFGEPGAEFTTLRPSVLGTTSTSVPWITSGAIINHTTSTTIPAGTTGNLSDFIDALFTGQKPELLGYGLWVQDTELSIYGTTAFGDTSVFTPIPTRSVTPNPATPAQAAAGLTISGTGWFPGAPVALDIHDCDSYDSIATDDDGSTVADADGTFSMQLAFDAEPAAGTYCYFLDDDDFLSHFVLREGTDLVIADAAPEGNTDTPEGNTDEPEGNTDAPEENTDAPEGNTDAPDEDAEDVGEEELTSTGAADATPWLLSAGAMLLLGAGALVVSGRSRRRHRA